MRSLRYHGQNLMGLLNKAKKVLFDNTGTGLLSTNVEDAIKEVNTHCKVKTVTETITTNVYGYIMFPIGRLVLMAFNTEFYGYGNFELGSSTDTPKQTISKRYFNINSGAMVDNAINTDYTVTYMYVDWE